MDRLYPLAVPLIFLGLMVGLFVAYSVRVALGRVPALKAVKHNQVFGPFFANFVVWFIGPIERRLLGRVSPNVITVTSLLMCVVTGAAVAVGELASAVALYMLAGILDVLDGRLARLSGKQTTSGALLDSVCDRWGELFGLMGYAWLLRDSAWLVGALAAIGGSMMVSYTRARAEGLGIQASGGIMQRAERMVLVALGTLIAAWFSTDPEITGTTAPILGVTLALCGAASCATAINRFRIAYKGLAAREPAPAPEPVRTKPARVPVLPAAATTQPHEV